MTDTTANVIEAEFETFDLDQAAQMMGAPSGDWLRRKLNEGRFSGRRVGRAWRMTLADMREAVDFMREKRPAKTPSTSPAPATRPATLDDLPARTRRHLARRSA